MIRDDALVADEAVWASFTAPQSGAEFYSSWLALLCTDVDSVTGALLLLGGGQDNTFTPAALWPDAGRDMSHLVPTAQRALTNRSGVVAAADGSREPSAEQPAHVAYPVVVAGELRGAVVLDLAARPIHGLRRALRQVHWATAWLNDVFRQQAMEAQKTRGDRIALAMDVVAVALQERRFGACALAVPTTLPAACTATA